MTTSLRIGSRPPKSTKWRTSEQILLSRPRQPRARGDHRERIDRARQAAEALFRSKPSVRELLAPEISNAARSAIGAQTARARNKPFGGAGPSRCGRSGDRLRAGDDARDTAVAIHTHPHLGKARHKGCPSCRGLRRCRRRHRTDYPVTLAGRFGPRSASPVKIESATWGTWRFHLKSDIAVGGTAATAPC